jgi:hypothetical protein
MIPGSLPSPAWATYKLKWYILVHTYVVCDFFQWAENPLKKLTSGVSQKLKLLESSKGGQSN